MQNKISLSVCMIVKNEEAVLEDCLKSILPVASEIIVVDTGSIDKTVDIARKYNCKLVRSRWDFDFSKARNISLENASGSHILIIDADERLENPYLVKSVLENSNDKIGGWLIKIVSRAKRNEGGSDTYISNLLRLFKNHPNIRFDGIIHEQVAESIIKQGYRITNSPLEIIHLGYDYSADKMHNKQIRNLELLNVALRRNPDNAYNLYNRAKTFLALNQLEKAENDIEHCLIIAKNSTTVRPQALNYGGIIAAQLGKYQLAIDRANESLEIIPDQAFAYFTLGEVYFGLERFNEALDAYQSMRQNRKTTKTATLLVGDYHLPPEQINFKVGKSFLGLGRVEEALTEFQSGSSINPRDVNNIIGLAKVEFLRKNYEPAQNYLNKATEIDPQNKDLKHYKKQFDDSMEMLKLRQKKIESEELPDINSIKPIVQKAHPLLTLAMIVKNEEKTLSGCLESVRDVVDEIVIVDTGSSDLTTQIAKKYGAKIFNFEWIDDFAAARNESIKHAEGKWILYLDADERLKPESKTILRNLIEKSSEEIAAYICTIESLHLQIDDKTEMHRGGYPRLFRNYGYPKIKFQGRVHEQITPSLFALNKTVDFSDIVIQHLGYDASREVMEKKVRRNYKMLLAHVQEEPMNAYAWFQLGQTLAQMKIFDQAENSIRMALKIGGLSKPLLASATATLAQIVGSRGEISEALRLADESLKNVPDQVFGLFLKACALLKLEKPKEAMEIFEQVREKSMQTRGVPRAGFDIIISDEAISIGLERCKKMINGAEI